LTLDLPFQALPNELKIAMQVIPGTIPVIPMPREPPPPLPKVVFDGARAMRAFSVRQNELMIRPKHVRAAIGVRARNAKQQIAVRQIESAASWKVPNNQVDQIVLFYDFNSDCLPELN
jgi:hypothetical protein